MKISKIRIETLQAEKGLSATQVAALAGISRQNYSIVKMRGTCRPETVGKIARALGVDINDLVEN